MGATFSHRKLEKVELNEARGVVGQNTFTDSEVQHLYQRFQTAANKGKNINAINFKKFVEGQKLFPSAPKNEQFNFLYRAVAEGNTEITWHSFLRYHLAVKFGFSTSKYRESLAAARRADDSGTAADNASFNPSSRDHTSFTLGDSDPSTSGSPTHRVAMDPGAQVATRRLLAQVYFHMLQGDGANGTHNQMVNHASMSKVFTDVARWTAENDATSSIAEEQITALTDLVLSELGVARNQLLTKTEFIEKFCSNDAAVFRLVAIL